VVKYGSWRCDLYAEQLTDLRRRDSFTGCVFRREAVAACDVLLFLFCFAPNQVTEE
jgi:hypothetical protein